MTDAQVQPVMEETAVGETPVPRQAKPKVTIGLPAYNEERHIAQALDSLREQTFRDFELIVADNASTDATPGILAAYAERDPRIRVIRRERNLGSLANINRMIDDARGEYFLLAGSHDLWSPNFVEALVRAIERDKRNVMAFGAVQWIDESGRQIEREQKIFMRFDGVASPVVRFNLLYWADPNLMYGLIRTTSLRKTRRFMRLMAPAAVLLAELAILGRFAHAPEAVYFVRENRAKETVSQRVDRYGRMMFEKPRRRVLPFWRLPPAFLWIALTTPVSGRRRRRYRLLLVLSSFMSVVRYWHVMVEDVRHLLRMDRGGSGEGE